MDQKQFSENKKAHKLYAKTPLFKALLIVIIPGLLMSLMNGVYAFSDQLIMAIMVPQNHTFEDIFGNMGEIKSAISDLNLYYEQMNISFRVSFYQPQDIVKAAISVSSPLTLVLAAFPFFIATGSGVLFTQSIGSNNQKKADQILKTSFWLVILFSSILALIIAPSSKYLLSAFAGKHTTLHEVDDSTLQPQYELIQKYLDTFRATQIQWGTDYVWVLASFLPLSCLIYFFAVLIRSEGRFRFVTITMTISNLFNIMFDFLLIKYAKMGMMGGSVASLLVAIITILCFVIYIVFLKLRHQQTWLNLKILMSSKTRINFSLLSPIIFIGLSGFLIEFCYSLTAMFYLPTLANISADVSVYGGEYFLTIAGAVIPIVNLFFMAMWGVIDGGRIIQSYNYSVNNYRRVKKTFWYTIIIGFTYGTLCFCIVAVSGIQLLKLFQIEPEMLFDAYQYLLLEMLLIPIFGFQISSVILYQSTNRIILANISSITQDVLCFYPTIAITIGMSIAFNNVWILISCYAINAIIAGALMTSFSSWYMQRRLGRREFWVNINNKSIRINIPYNKKRITKNLYK